MNPQIDILMATYNGANYVAEQVESILNQTYPNIRLIIRDDGSTDNTLCILHHYSQKYPRKIHLHPTGKNLGIRGNFSFLLEQAQAPYIMLSDQDDVWDKEKILETLTKMHDLEGQHGKEKPLLVHTNLRVVNSMLQLIHPSFWQYAKLKPEKALSLNRLLNQNAITGCTVLLNQSLLKASIPIPQECLMHDWWLALVASAFGAIGYLEKPTINYRQHDQNNLGAQKFSFYKGFKKWLNIQKNRAEGRAYEEKNFKQAEVFKQRYNQNLSKEQVILMDAYLTLQKSPSLLKELTILFKHRFFKQGSIRNLARITSRILRRIIRMHT